MAALPRRVIAWYGDDFTGSTDVLEVLASAGLDPVLFLLPPNDEDLSRFTNARAVGIAGVSRARSPGWMDVHLPGVFTALAEFNTPLLHYKVCSTFDSSPTIGSIGRALEIGRRVLGERQATPIVVGTPALKRYTAFGQLFATVDEVTWRIDQHPTMSCHPVTPMNEADLRRHLGYQTKLPIALFDLNAMRSSQRAQRYMDVAEATPGGILIDVVDDETLWRAGELIWKNTTSARLCVGSSGLEHALIEYWRHAKLFDSVQPKSHVPPVDRLLTISGSCSPATDAQIEAAEAAGHEVITLSAMTLLGDDMASSIAPTCSRASTALARGRSVIVCTARGPHDPAIVEFQDCAVARSLDAAVAARRVGSALGAVLRELVCKSALKRVVIAGGDTSGDVASALRLRALTMLAPLAPGAPICLAYAPGTVLDGLELVLKGGQIGRPTFLEEVRCGGSSNTV